MKILRTKWYTIRQTSSMPLRFKIVDAKGFATMRDAKHTGRIVVKGLQILRHPERYEMPQEVLTTTEAQP